MALIISMFCFMYMIFSNPVITKATTLKNAPNSNLDTYIVHVNLPTGRVLADSDELTSWYNSFLPKTTTDEEGSSRLVHSYRNVITGFAAKLSPEEVKEMEKIDGYINARPQKKIPLHTTHSPNFLGLNQNLGFWRGSNYGEGVIIGLLDTGIATDHPSFDDKDMPPPPNKWKGKCEFSGTTCNNKLIGARNFVSDSPGPPVDDEGHGTHTASTAGGNFVQDANVFGMASGTAVGMAPRAHVAMYKVCSAEGCSDADILAAMDAAVEDGVDVLSLSLGGGSVEFFDDGIAVGAFAAIQKGIFVSCSAGNSGPFSASLSNEAPWILTVGASTIDRNLIASAVLGNTDGYDGESLFQPSDFPSDIYLPLIDPGAGGNQTAVLCGPGSLDQIDVKGKIVLCQRGGGIARVPRANGEGSLRTEFGQIQASLNPTSSALCRILAAWRCPWTTTRKKATFNVISGTSMSCPHLSGIAALLKSAHPDWSPAAIKSAIMTSATQVNLLGGAIDDERYKSADIFALGAGHVNPPSANDPGLVYDLQPQDYIPYLCGLGYSDKQIQFIVQQPVSCSNITSIPEAQLNYPSFSIELGSDTKTYTRTVTNVGEANATYTVSIELDSGGGVVIGVTPATISFTGVNQKMTYEISFSKYGTPVNATFVQGAIFWRSTSPKRAVRSPISIKLV
ncbi:hypothetical protein DH2020_005391 [Rehmannia glutinosa]|uniref:Uncharacterized protein n=1 Tax=Rehmannia glutinosa TaxID=99300 RepID=A0ABR0XFY1_REHGL